jgi:hypothetical protein
VRPADGHDPQAVRSPTGDHPHIRHESTQTTHIYEHADPALKEKAIARTTPLGIKPGRYRPSDTLLAFLDTL